MVFGIDRRAGAARFPDRTVLAVPLIHRALLLTLARKMISSKRRAAFRQAGLKVFTLRFAAQYLVKWVYILLDKITSVYYCAALTGGRMHPTHVRPVPNLSHLKFGTLILGGPLAAGLAWSMFR